MYDEPRFTSPKDERRYHAHFQGGGRLWPLPPHELEIARFLFDLSPSLRRIRSALDESQATLDMAALRRWTVQRPERRLPLCLALPVITLPHLARAYFTDPPWGLVAAVLDPAELHALASALALKETKRRGLRS